MHRGAGLRSGFEVFRVLGIVGLKRLHSRDRPPLPFKVISQIAPRTAHRLPPQRFAHQISNINRLASMALFGRLRVGSIYGTSHVRVRPARRPTLGCACSSSWNRLVRIRMLGGVGAGAGNRPGYPI